MQDGVITDTQILQEFEKLASAEKVTPEEQALVVAMNVRPIRIRYPAKACRSPYRNNEVRAGFDKFTDFVCRGGNEMLV